MSLYKHCFFLEIVFLFHLFYFPRQVIPKISTFIFQRHSKSTILLSLYNAFDLLLFYFLCAIYTKINTGSMVEKGYNSFETKKEGLMAYTKSSKCNPKACPA